MVQDAAKMEETDFTQFMAFMVAHMRGVESAREDSVCHDPLAEPLTRQIAPQLAPHISKWRERQPHTGNYIALSTRYLDEALNQRDASIRQVVLLGSGLDARAYYLESLADCHVLEIDRNAELLAHKQDVVRELGLSPLARRYDCLLADLTAFNWEETLLSSGFDPTLPTFWVLQNLLIYLERPSIIALLKTIDVLSAPGSEIWGDVIGKTVEKEEEVAFTKDINALSKNESGEALHKFGEDDALSGVFSELPWELERQVSFEEGKSYFGREWVHLLEQTSKRPVHFSLVHGKKPVSAP